MNGKRPTVSSMHGVVAAAHPLAAQAGVKLLGEGGNAFDAAVAVAAALNVCEPSSSGLAGMGVATCWVAAERRARVLDFTGRVPRAFPVGRFRNREDMGRGAAACGMPTNLAGWCELGRAYGRKPLRDIFAPAARLARDGVPLIDYGLYARERAGIEMRSDDRFSEWRRVFGKGAYAGAGIPVLRQPDLAATLDAIAEDGPAHLYNGPLGRALVACVAAAGGFVAEADLSDVRPNWKQPATAVYRGLVVNVPPPPLEAFQLLLTLRILDGFEFGGLPRNGPLHLDLVWRATRLAAGVRIACNNPLPGTLAHLLSDAHVGALRARASDGLFVGGPTEQAPEPASPDPARSHTTSFSVADGEGNAVCVTQSLGQLYGSGIVVPGTGVCLNNFHYWGELNPTGANALRPGEPFALPLAPSITIMDGKPVLVLGTPGGYGICQTQAQVMVHRLDYGLPLQQAIEEPRARLWDDRAVNVEGRLAEGVSDALSKLGHVVRTVQPWTPEVGGMQGIAIDPGSGTMTGAADPRRDGYVAVA